MTRYLKWSPWQAKLRKYSLISIELCVLLKEVDNPLKDDISVIKYQEQDRVDLDLQISEDELLEEKMSEAVAELDDDDWLEAKMAASTRASEAKFRFIQFKYFH
ncbi:hypothetical protein NDU88_007557 [Pleurodeles waltl]|uniref:Uncharacterized protein n=1 Tax=Pleurodeles waltl TaxID=8319 RepID=A0AAV7PLN2_PLEWA|nr:hypothetical protein NDU88_007557 [Pleurodeles waltl]